MHNWSLIEKLFGYVHMYLCVCLFISFPININPFIFKTSQELNTLCLVIQKLPLSPRVVPHGGSWPTFLAFQCDHSQRSRSNHFVFRNSGLRRKSRYQYPILEGLTVSQTRSRDFTALTFCLNRPIHAQVYRTAAAASGAQTSPFKYFEILWKYCVRIVERLKEGLKIRGLSEGPPLQRFWG